MLASFFFGIFLFAYPVEVQAQEPATASNTAFAWTLAGSYAGITLGVGAATLILNNLPEDDRLGARVGLQVLAMVIPAALGTLGGWLGNEGGSAGWNADLGASIASAQAFGWIGAGLGYAISTFAGASPEVHLISAVSVGLGGALLATLLQALAVQKIRPLPPLAGVGFGMVAGLITALISGIAGSEQVGRNSLLGATIGGLAGGIFGFALAI